MIKYLVFFSCLFGQSLLFGVHPQLPAVVGVPTAVLVQLETSLNAAHAQLEQALAGHQERAAQAAQDLQRHRERAAEERLRRQPLEERLRREPLDVLQQRVERSLDNLEMENNSPRLYLAIGGISLLGWLGYLFWTKF